MSAPFRAQAFGRVVLLQTAAEWAETTDKVLQDYETGRETDTGYEKTGDGVSTWAELAYDDPTPTPGGVKVYRALLTQAGTDAPVATVLENTLGGTLVWTRADAGQYVGTLAGAFSTTRHFNWLQLASTASVTDAPQYVKLETATANTVLLTTGDQNNGIADDILVDPQYVEILVYP